METQQQTMGSQGYNTQTTAYVNETKVSRQHASMARSKKSSVTYSMLGRDTYTTPCLLRMFIGALLIIMFFICILFGLFTRVIHDIEENKAIRERQQAGPSGEGAAGNDRRTTDHHVARGSSMTMDSRTTGDRPNYCYSRPCQHYCEDVGGSVVCTCAPGYQLQSDLISCLLDSSRTLLPTGRTLALPANDTSRGQMGSMPTLEENGTSLGQMGSMPTIEGATATLPPAGSTLALPGAVTTHRQFAPVPSPPGADTTLAQAEPTSPPPGADTTVGQPADTTVAPAAAVTP